MALLETNTITNHGAFQKIVYFCCSDAVTFQHLKVSELWKRKHEPFYSCWQESLKSQILSTIKEIKLYCIKNLWREQCWPLRYPRHQQKIEKHLFYVLNLGWSGWEWKSVRTQMVTANSMQEFVWIWQMSKPRWWIWCITPSLSFVWNSEIRNPGWLALELTPQILKWFKQPWYLNTSTEMYCETVS